jgi:hypothetical protein
MIGLPRPATVGTMKTIQNDGILRLSTEGSGKRLTLSYSLFLFPDHRLYRILQGTESGPDDVPEDRRFHGIVRVNADVPEPGNLSSLDLRVASGDLGRDLFRRFPDSDEPEHDGAKAHAIPHELLERPVPNIGTNGHSGVANVLKVQQKVPRHRQPRRGQHPGSGASTCRR